jgi:hypothetical protein
MGASRRKEQLDPGRVILIKYVADADQLGPEFVAMRSSEQAPGPIRKGARARNPSPVARLWDVERPNAMPDTSANDHLAERVVLSGEDDARR